MTDYSELKSAAEASIKAWDQHFQADSHEFYEAWCAAEEAFSMAAREEIVLAMIAENEELKARLADCAEFIDNAPGDYAEIEALRKAMAECTSSLEGEVLQKYHGQKPEDMHPVTRRDYDRDMAEINGYKAMSKESP